MKDLENDKIDVIAAVIQNEGQYLLCQRPHGKRYGGQWEFPGGKLEAGETFFEAAQRELQEELGVEVLSLGEFLAAYDDPGSHFKVHFWEIAIYGTPRPLEHAQVAWVPADDLLSYDLAVNDSRFCELLKH